MNLFSTTETNKLSNIQVNLEKSINLVLEHLKRYPDYGIYEYSVELNRERQSVWEVFQVKINDILEPLRSKIKLIKDNNWDDITDFKHFKKEMIVIQDNIQNLRSETKVKTQLLEKESISISEDVCFYNDMMLQWEEPVKINVYYNINSQTKSIKNTHQCREVKEFMDFIHTCGGHENGWSKADHQLFIKFRNKYKNIDTIAIKLHEELPDVRIEEIKCHEEWYKKYINLQKKKRDALNSWQKARTNNKCSLKYSNIPPKIVNVLEPDENIQEKLVKWKAEREERMKSVKQIEACREQKRKELEQLKKKRHEELRKIVQEWKQSKQTMEQQETAERRNLEEHEKKKRALEANKMIKQFQSQDDTYILKLKQQRKSDKTPQIRSKSSQVVKRDPERLFKPTKQWINRVHDEKYDSSDFTTVMDLKCLPKLRIPEWRRKLN